MSGSSPRAGAGAGAGEKGGSVKVCGWARRCATGVVMKAKFLRGVLVRAGSWDAWTLT